MVPFSCLVRQQCCIFTVQGPTACLPPGCFISAHLGTVSTLKVLANTSATQTHKQYTLPCSHPFSQTVCFVVHKRLAGSTLVQAYIMQQLKKSTPGHGIQLQLLIARHHKSHRQKLPQYRYWPSLYLGLQADFFDLSPKSKLYSFEIETLYIYFLFSSLSKHELQTTERMFQVK